jgi:hypothetical protein
MNSKPVVLLVSLYSLTLMAITACTHTLSTRPDSPGESNSTTSLALEGDRGVTSHEQRLALAKRNTQRAESLIQSEYSLYGTVYTQPHYPEFGIALSGGGSRSAAFSLGVLAALRDAGRHPHLAEVHETLTNVDIISSVSGGGYANYYLAVNGLSYAALDYQALLEPGPPLSTAASRGLTDTLWLGWSFVTPLVCLPFRYLFSVVPSEGPGLACGHSNYFISLAGAYDPHSFFHSADLSALKDKTSTTDRRAFPIFVATVYVGEDRRCSKVPASSLTSLFTSVFEMNPVRSGSEWVGYEPTEPQRIGSTEKGEFRVELAEAAGTSGAGIDQRTSGACKWIHAFGYSLGLSIDRFYGVRPELSGGAVTDDREDANLEDRRKAFYDNGVGPLSIALVDGGETENLAVYPLIKRLTRNILIVDGEFDPEQQFGAYWCLKTKLATQGIELRIDGIEEQPTEGPRPCEETIKSKQTLVEKRANPVVTVAQARQFGYAGQVGGLSRFTKPTGNEDVDSRPFRVTYVKLGMPAGEMSSFIHKVTNDYLRNVEKGVPKDLAEQVKAFIQRNREAFVENGALVCRANGIFNSLRCPFPSVETTNQNLGVVQYYAYYFLGRYAMDTYLAKNGEKVFAE